MTTTIDPVGQAQSLHYGTRDVRRLLEEAQTLTQQASELARHLQREALESRGPDLALTVSQQLEALVEDIEGTSGSVFTWEAVVQDARDVEAIAAGVERTRAESRRQLTA